MDIYIIGEKFVGKKWRNFWQVTNLFTEDMFLDWDGLQGVQEARFRSNNNNCIFKKNITKEGLFCCTTAVHELLSRLSRVTSGKRIRKPTYKYLQQFWVRTLLQRNLSGHGLFSKCNRLYKDLWCNVVGDRWSKILTYHS